MFEPIILSDEEDQNPVPSPVQQVRSKKRLTGPDRNPIPTVVVLDDDPTPQKPGSSSTPSFVPETPMSDVVIVKCSKVSSDPQATASNSENKFSGISRFICLESDNESEGGSRKKNWNENETLDPLFDWEKDLNWNQSSSFSKSTGTLEMSEHGSSGPSTLRDDDISQAGDIPGAEHAGMDQTENTVGKKTRKVNAEKKKSTGEAKGRKKLTEEEKTRLKEEKKLQKQQEKLQKEALKAEAAELKKIEKEKKKSENGKFAQKSIVAEIDPKVIEMGSVGGNLLTRFAEKGFKYRIKSNPIERSIVWMMEFPEHISDSELSPKRIEIPYVLLVYEAEEFCKLVVNESLLDHVIGVRSHYPSHTVCYLTNKLMTYINKREQEHYKNPANGNGWKRPPVEEVLAKLSTHFVKVHSRQCVDDFELAEHVVGLTGSLASCQFRKKLTRLSVNANGSLIPKDCVDRNLIKNNLWLKALVAIPKVQPRFAVTIWKKYPTMRSLLNVYMDSTKSVNEKEFLLKDLTVEGLIGEDRRLGEVCSKRVYRILMAQNGCTKTDDVEDGADFFARQSS
ncbi:hypothetical protein UlMin_038048 [Ulmus minor]